MGIKEDLNKFWADLQAWVGASPWKSAVLAVACIVIGWTLRYLVA